MMQEKKKKLTGQQGELMRALDITMDDLIANDEGIITPQQQETTLKKQAYLWLKYDVSAFLLGATGMIYSVGNLLLTRSILASLTPVVLFLIMATGFYMMGLRLQKRIKADLSKNVLQTTQGILVINNQEGNSYLEINDMKLFTSPDVLRRIQHLQPYIVHYLPDSKVILSMEEISNDSNLRKDVSQNENYTNTGEVLTNNQYE